MGTFYTGCRIDNHVDRSKSVQVAKLLVGTGSEHTWIPATKLEKIGVRREKKDISFVTANGEVVTRSVGFAILRVGKHFTIDEVVFAEKGDLALLGSRTLEGLNLTVDPTRKKLVAAGPVPAAQLRPTLDPLGWRRPEGRNWRKGCQRGITTGQPGGRVPAAGLHLVEQGSEQADHHHSHRPRARPLCACDWRAGSRQRC